MKKKALSLLLVLSMCLTLLPTAALADYTADPTEPELTGAVFEEQEEPSDPEDPEPPEQEEPEDPEPPVEPETPDQTEEGAAEEPGEEVSKEPSEEPEEIQDEESPAAEELLAEPVPLTAGSSGTLQAGGHSGDHGEYGLPEGKTWQAWTDELAKNQDTLGKSYTASNSLPAQPGYYYLTKDVEIGTWIPADGTVLCLNGYTILDSGVEAIKIESGKTFTLCDCKNTGKITYNYNSNSEKTTSGNSGGGVTVEGTFNMYGGIITGDKRYNDAGVTVDGDGAVFNMYDGTISDNQVIDDSYHINGQAAGVAVNSGTFNMSGGTISGNTADRNGGGVYVAQNAAFNLSGGTISGNTAGVTGGGVYVLGTFTMKGGTISGNSAQNSAGGVFVITSKVNNVTYTGKFIMSGGSVTGNNVADTSGVGGGVCVNTDAIMKISGNVEIRNNWQGGSLNTNGSGYVQSSGTANNLYLSGSSSNGQTLVTVTGSLTGTHPIGISKNSSKMPTADNPVKIAVGESYALKETDTSHFTPDAGDDYEVVYSKDENALYLAAVEPHTHYICGEDTCSDNHDQVNFKPLTVNQLGEYTYNSTGVYYYYRDLPEGNWYLTDDLKPDATIRITGKVNLCLNGHSRGLRDQTRRERQRQPDALRLPQWRYQRRIRHNHDPKRPRCVGHAGQLYHVRRQYRQQQQQQHGKQLSWRRRVR